MDRNYLTDFCLRNESYFENSHPDYDDSKAELVLTIDAVMELIDECKTELDTVGISIPVSEIGKWDALEIHGSTDSQKYTIEYQKGKLGGSFIKKEVSRTYLVKILNEIEDFVSGVESSSEFVFRHW